MMRRSLAGQQRLLQAAQEAPTCDMQTAMAAPVRKQWQHSQGTQPAEPGRTRHRYYEGNSELGLQVPFAGNILLLRHSIAALLMLLLAITMNSTFTVPLSTHERMS